MTPEERNAILKDDLSIYIKEHYGICTLEVCQCLKTGWRGRNCPNWVPVKASNWNELMKEMGA